MVVLILFTVQLLWSKGSRLINQSMKMIDLSRIHGHSSEKEDQPFWKNICIRPSESEWKYFFLVSSICLCINLNLKLTMKFTLHYWILIVLWNGCSLVWSKLKVCERSAQANGIIFSHHWFSTADWSHVFMFQIHCSSALSVMIQVTR